jgi:predicted DCC family thiol-disulfide oxidoreductase YuxK
MARKKNPPPDDELALIYDQQCPVCSAYSAAVEVEDGAASGVRRIDARSDDALVQQALAAGLDLDEGMVLVHNGKLYHGADALNRMALLAPRTGVRNRLNRMLFSNPTMSRISYPLLRGGRNTLLRLLGRSKISAGKTTR